jgi:hypothetical protein
MADATAGPVGTDEWAGLLQQTRRALSTLCAADLEELAIRAERMSAPSAGFSSRPPEYAQTSDLRILSAERRLLGSLLLATRRNLDVLQRPRANADSPGWTREVNRRWAR